VIRVVPRVEREEFVNAGVIVFCLEKNFLGARVRVNVERLKALWTEVDVDLVRQHLEAFPKIAAGDASAGPIAQLSLRERFHWLVSPRSTMIQVSPVHSGICVSEPQEALDRLFDRLTC
jgi:hypothetical protein